jgi:hypothetical protein
VTNYSQDRITRLVRDGHISLLAEWVNQDGRLVGDRLRHDFEEGTEGNWWTQRTGNAPHPSLFARGERIRVVNVIEPWEGKRTSIVAFRINDPEDWRRCLREDSRLAREQGWLP